MRTIWLRPDLAPYENEPNTSVVFLIFYSKNEYSYLTEEGYKAAEVPIPPEKQVARPTEVGRAYPHSDPHRPVLYLERKRTPLRWPARVWLPSGAVLLRRRIFFQTYVLVRLI